MDAKVLSARERADESIVADGEIVWSRSPDAGVKLCEKCSQGDGG